MEPSKDQDNSSDDFEELSVRRSEDLDPRASTDPIENTEPIVPEPLSLRQATIKAIAKFHHDEQSGLVPEDVIEKVAGDMLGEKITSGLYINHTSKVPRLHLIKVPSKDTLKDTDTTQKRFLQSMEYHQTIEASTPGKNALRVAIILFQSFPDINADSAKKLTRLRKEATSIDLNNPEDKDWKRAFALEVNGKQIEFTIELEKNSLLTRFISYFGGRDIPKDQRLHRYSYKMELSLAQPLKTKQLTALQNRAQQAKAIMYTATPTVISSWLIASSEISKTVSSVFTNPVAKSITEVGVDVLLPFSIGVAAYMYITGPLSRNRHR